MKIASIIALLILSSNLFAQAGTTKARGAVIPAGTQTRDTVKTEKKVEAPCADSKEDILKKLEEKKKAQAQAHKGFSLQGNNDTGCKIN